MSNGWLRGCVAVSASPFSLNGKPALICPTISINIQLLLSRSLTMSEQMSADTLTGSFAKRSFGCPVSRLPARQNHCSSWRNLTFTRQQIQLVDGTHVSVGRYMITIISLYSLPRCNTIPRAYEPILVSFSSEIRAFTKSIIRMKYLNVWTDDNNMTWLCE